MYRAKSEAKRAGRGRATQGTGKEPAHRGRRRARRARESRGGGDSRAAASCRIGTARSRHRASSSPAALSRRYLAQCGTLECSRSRSFRGLRVLDGPSGVQKMGPPDHDRMMGHYLGPGRHDHRRAYHVAKPIPVLFCPISASFLHVPQHQASGLFLVYVCRPPSMILSHFYIPKTPNMVISRG